MPKAVWTITVDFPDGFFEEAKARVAFEPVLDAFTGAVFDIPNVAVEVAVSTNGHTKGATPRPQTAPKGRPVGSKNKPKIGAGAYAREPLAAGLTGEWRTDGDREA